MQVREIKSTDKPKYTVHVKDKKKKNPLFNGIYIYVCMYCI